MMLLIADIVVATKGGLRRDAVFAELRQKIEAEGDRVSRLRLECRKAYLWLGEGCVEGVDLERFEQEAKAVLDAYGGGASRHWRYLELAISYAQLQPKERRERLLWSIIEMAPETIVPEGVDSAVDDVNEVKRTAIWAMLNGRIRSTLGQSGEVVERAIVNESEDVLGRLARSGEGRRVAPFVEWYRAVGTADEGERIPKPKVTPPEEIGQPYQPESTEDVSVSEAPPAEDGKAEVASKEEAGGGMWADEYDALSVEGSIDPPVGPAARVGGGASPRTWTIYAGIALLAVGVGLCGYAYQRKRG